MSSDLEYNLLFQAEDPRDVGTYLKALIAGRTALSTFAGPIDGWTGGTIINLALVKDFTLTSNVPDKATRDDPDSKPTLDLVIPDDVRAQLGLGR